MISESRLKSNRSPKRAGAFPCSARARMCASASTSCAAYARRALALAALALALSPAAAQCGVGSYSYGSGACASCASGAAWVSSAAGCTPSGTLTAGPTDTAFYLSGEQAEGVAAFSLVSAPVGVAYAQSVFGAASGALALARGSYLAAAGAAAPAVLPSGSAAAFSASAWVKCAAPATYSAVLEWGTAGDAQAVALVVAGAATQSVSGVVTTFAGSSKGSADGTGTAASFSNPLGMAFAPSGGAMIVTDNGNHNVRLISATGNVTTLAGGSQGYADGFGTSAQFNGPSSAALCSSNDAFVVADQKNHRIRLVSLSGNVTTLAGSSQGFADGTGVAASFNEPFSVATIPSSGVVVVADMLNARIRLVSPLGVVSTLAGRFSIVPEFSDGVGSNAAFFIPQGVAVIPSSEVIVVVDSGNQRIRLITPAGLVTTLAGSGYPGVGGFADGTGSAALFNFPIGAAVIPSTDFIVVGDWKNNRVRLVSPTGVVTTLAGQDSGTADGAGTVARFTSPQCVAIRSNGAMMVSDSGNNRIRVLTPRLALQACDGTWHHAALVYSPSSLLSLSAFLDGAFVVQILTPIALPEAAASSLRVGWSGDLATSGGSLFAGTLAELRIYARALSTVEVVALSQPPLNAFLASFPNTTAPPPSANATSYAFACIAGYTGPTSLLNKDSIDGSWAWAGSGSPACAACAAGSSSAGGPATCFACASGTFTQSPGLLCAGTPCAPGRAGPCGATSQRAANCTLCAPGLWSGVSGAGNCSGVACAADFVGPVGATSAAAAECRKCPAGTSAAVGASQCIVPAANANFVSTAAIVVPIVIGLLAVGATAVAYMWRLNRRLKLTAAAARSGDGAVNVLVSAINASRRHSKSGGLIAIARRDDEDLTMLRFSDLVPDPAVQPLSGGFGVVFAAHWVSRGIRVAVKVPKDLVVSGYLPPAAAAELIKEAQGLVRASDGNVNEFVVRLFGVAQGQGGAAWAAMCDRTRELHFSRKGGTPTAPTRAPEGGAAPATESGGVELLGLVMAWEDGGTLADCLQPPPKTLRVAWPGPSQLGDKLRLARELAIGLFHLHRVGIVHGDLKLENVLLSGEDRRVRLADFGLAELKSRADAAATQHSRVSTAQHTDSKRGTWPYMAPEMFASASQRAVAANRGTDVFAFGTLLWELFTGLAPWQELTRGPSAAADPSAARLSSMRDGKTLDLARLPAGVPPVVAALIKDCLALDRRARPRMGRVRAVLEQAREEFLGGRFDVFLSHAWGKGDSRKPLTDAIYFALREHGLRVWLDSNEMGHDLKASMADGIGKSDVVLVLLSSDYQRSRQCMFELRFAAGIDDEASAARDAARAQLDKVRAVLADAQLRYAAAATQGERAATEAHAKVAKQQRSLDTATAAGDENIVELVTGSLAVASVEERRVRIDAVQSLGVARAASEAAASAVLAAEVALAIASNLHTSCNAAERAHVDAARNGLAQARQQGAAADALASGVQKRARDKVATLQRSLADAMAACNETVADVIAAALANARGEAVVAAAEGVQLAAVTRAASDAAAAALAAAEAELAGIVASAAAAVAAAVASRKRPLVCCVVEPGIWTSWAPSDELRDLAGLASYLYADASEAARVNFAAEVVPESERRKLTHNPKALPRILDLIAAARKRPVDDGSGAGSDVGSGLAQPSASFPALSASAATPGRPGPVAGTA